MPKLLHFLNTSFPISEVKAGRVVRLNRESNGVYQQTPFFGHIVGFYITENPYELKVRVDFNGITQPYASGCLELL